VRKIVVVAEAGVNHNGDLSVARELVDFAAVAGADFVKFQTFKAERLVTRGAAKAVYQKSTTDSDEGQFAMLKRLELSEAAHPALLDHCAKRGIAFLSTPFDKESLTFLNSTLGLSVLKISSGDLTNGPLLVHAARTGARIILSTGMADLREVEAALGCLAFGYAGRGEPCEKSFRDALASTDLREKVTLLHCTTEYPAPVHDVNLRAMVTLRETFGLDVGYSDHTSGIAISLAAAALGATVIEKHFTVSRQMSGPDHAASLEPGELASLVTGIREIEAAMGDGIKRPSPSEAKNLAAARKSLVVARAVRRGEILTEENLAAKRPGDGVSPMQYWDWAGKPALRDYAEDEPFP
jgi:N-acetylneuraminate synthase